MSHHPGFDRRHRLTRKLVGIAQGVDLGGRAYRSRAPDLTLVRMVHRATSWVEKLREGAAVSSLAAAENVQVPFVSRRIHLGLLSPKIVTAIVEGRLPAHLTTQALIDMDLPMNWREQEAKLLGA